MPPYSLVIFDFGGTLADSLSWFLESMNKAAERFGFKKVDPDEIEMMRRFDHGQILRYLGIPKWKMPLITLYLRQIQANAIDTVPLFSGVDKVLHDLASAGITLAIVSSNSKANVVRALGAEASATISHFGCGLFPFGKASRFKAILSKSGIAPQRAIGVGDEIRDLQAARAANMATGVVAWGYADFPTLLSYSPTQSFESVADMKGSLLLG